VNPVLTDFISIVISTADLGRLVEARKRLVFFCQATLLFFRSVPLSSGTRQRAASHPMPTISLGNPMSSRFPVELAKSYRLLNHGPTVLVTSAHAEMRNVMAAAWSMPLDFSPPKVAVVIDRNTLTRELVEASGEFALNVPSRDLARMALAVGSESGRDVDKFRAHDIATFAAKRIGAPLLEGCLGWLECRVLPEPHVQKTYDLFLAEVVAAWADPAAFEGGHWHIEQGGRRSIHYIAGGHFFETGTAFEVQK
jgi:flavin reductase (DIM6/NTAB) family NADH-FMN oxidoreductase RutF